MRANALLLLTVLSFLVAAAAGYRLLQAYREKRPFLTEYLLFTVWLAMLIVCLALRSRMG